MLAEGGVVNGEEEPLGQPSHTALQTPMRLRWAAAAERELGVGVCGG